MNPSSVFATFDVMVFGRSLPLTVSVYESSPGEDTVVYQVRSGKLVDYFESERIDDPDALARAAVGCIWSSSGVEFVRVRESA